MSKYMPYFIPHNHDNDCSVLVSTYVGELNSLNKAKVLNWILKITENFCLENVANIENQ